IQGMSARGPGRATILSVSALLDVSWAIELLGLFGVDKAEFSIRKLLGLVVAVAGVVVFEWEK
ncbi:MAG: DMT family transporter, partial [Lachnospiraceae bacterium]|nr:DMT family transporter [Lachnospiraceae bacterium]